MSNSGLGYSVLDPRATFVTYLGAGKILAHKIDSVPTTEADATDDVIAIWGNQTDDWIDQLNEWLTGNAAAPGPIILNTGGLVVDYDNGTVEIGDGTGDPSTLLNKGAASISTIDFDVAGVNSHRYVHTGSETLRHQSWSGAVWLDVWEVAENSQNVAFYGSISTVGNITAGNATGSHDVRVTKNSGGEAKVRFSTSVSSTVFGDKVIVLDAAEELLIKHWNGATWDVAIRVDNAIDVWFGGDINLETTSQINLGDGTGNAKGLYINKGAASTGTVLELSSASNRDWLLQWLSDEDLTLYRYIGGALQGIALELANADGLLTLGANAILNSANAVLTVGSGTGTPKFSHNKSDAGSARVLEMLMVGTVFWALGHNVSENFTISRYSGGAFVDAVTAQTSTGAWLFPANVTLDSASPTLTVGDGAGSPVISANKSAAGSFQLQMRTTGALDWTLYDDVSENFVLVRYIAGALQEADTIVVTNATGNIAVAKNVTLDSASPALLIGDLTGSPLLNLQKSDAGTAVINLLAPSGVGGGRWTIQYDAVEDLNVQRRDNVGGFIENLLSLSVGTGLATFAQNVSLSSASPSLLVGDYAGAPSVRLRKADASSSDLAFYSDSVLDWQFLHYGGDDNLYLQCYRPGAPTVNMVIFTATNVSFAHVGVNLTNASPILAVGSGTGAPAMYLRKANASASEIRFLGNGTGLTANDKRFTHTSAELLNVEHYNGSSWVLLMSFSGTLVTIDVSIALTSSTASITLGNGTGDVGGLILNKGAASTGTIFDLSSASNKDWILKWLSDEDISLQRYIAGAFQGIALKIANANGLFTFGANAIWDSANATVTIGNGTGTPKFSHDKSDADASPVLEMLVAGTISWAVGHNASENLTISRYVGGALADVVKALASSGTWQFPTNVMLDSASPVLTVGNGTGAPSIVIDKADASASDIRFSNVNVLSMRVKHETDESLRWQRWDGGAWDDMSRWYVTTGNAQFFHDLTLFSADPILRVGDGTGTPKFSHNKSNAGNSRVLEMMMESVVFWSLTHNDSENFTISRYVGGAFVDAVTALTSTGEWIFPGNVSLTSAAPTLTVGNGTGAPSITLNKADASGSDIRFVNFGTLNWRWYHFSDENLYLQCYLPGASDVNMGVFSSNTFQWRGAFLHLNSASPTLTLGNGTGSPVSIFNKSAAGVAYVSRVNVVGVVKWEILVDSSEVLVFKAYDDSGLTPVNVLALNDGTYEAVFAANVTLSSASPTLTVGDATGTPIIATNKDSAGVGYLLFRNEAVTRARVLLNGALTLQFQVADSGGATQASADMAATTGQWSFPHNVLLVAASPVLSLGSGAGASTVLLSDATASDSNLRYSGGGNAFWDLRRLATSGDFIIRRYVGGTGTDNPLTLFNATGNATFTGGTTYLSNANGVLVVGDGTGGPVIGLNKGDATFSRFVYSSGGTDYYWIYLDAAENLFISTISGGAPLHATVYSATGDWGMPAGLLMGSSSPVLTIGNGGGGPAVILVKADASITGIQFWNGANQRWQLHFDANENLTIRAYDGSGTYQYDAMHISQSTGEVTFEKKVFCLGAVDVTGATTLKNTVALTSITNTTLALGDNNNVALPAGSALWRVTPNAGGSAITGITPINGQIIVLRNVSGTVVITIKHNNASSTAANRIHCPGGVNLTIPVLGSRLLIYDATSARWAVIGAVA